MSQFKHIVLRYMQEARRMNRVNKSCHIAVLLKGKRKICSYGFNQMDRQCYRGKHVSSLHAEVDCVRKMAEPLRAMRRYTLVVAKVSKNDDSKMYSSMPCKECTKYLLGLGFKSIYCSTHHGTIVKVHLNKYVPYDT